MASQNISGIDFASLFQLFSQDNPAEGQNPEEVILSFKPLQGKYIKSLPLHETQRVILDTLDELQIKLDLCVTFDFVMELLSYGDNLKVIKPKSLIKEIKMAHQKALNQYQNLKP